MTASEKRKTVLLLGLTLVWTGFIFHRSLQPAQVSHDESTAVLNPLLRLFPGLTLHLVRKLAHFTEYFILGILAWSSVDRLTRPAARRLALPLLWAPELYCLLAACADEGIQRFVPGRSGELADVLLDFVGAAAACLICCLIACLRRKRNHGGDYNG